MFFYLAILVHIPCEGKSITGSAAESGCNWDRDGFKKWSEWTNEDFHYHEAQSGMDCMEEKSGFLFWIFRRENVLRLGVLEVYFLKKLEICRIMSCNFM